MKNAIWQAAIKYVAAYSLYQIVREALDNAAVDLEDSDGTFGEFSVVLALFNDPTVRDVCVEKMLEIEKTPEQEEKLKQLLKALKIRKPKQAKQKITNRRRQRRFFSRSAHLLICENLLLFDWNPSSFSAGMG